MVTGMLAGKSTTSRGIRHGLSCHGFDSPPDRQMPVSLFYELIREEVECEAFAERRISASRYALGRRFVAAGGPSYAAGEFRKSAEGTRWRDSQAGMLRRLPSGKNWAHLRTRRYWCGQFPGLTLRCTRRAAVKRGVSPIRH